MFTCWCLSYTFVHVYFYIGALFFGIKISFLKLKLDQEYNGISKFTQYLNIKKSQSSFTPNDLCYFLKWLNMKII